MKNQEEDFYINEKGQTVFTAFFLQKRGYCCGNGCLHCPYEYEGVRNKELRKNLLNKSNADRKAAPTDSEQ